MTDTMTLTELHTAINDPESVEEVVVEVPENPVARIFNGKLTLTNISTGDHRTFSVKTQKEDAKFAPGKRVIALLTGPSNEYDYTGFGFVNDQGIAVWSSKRGNGKPSNFEWFADMVGVLAGGFSSRFGKDYQDYELLVEGKCIVCNRTLTTPESIKSGIGPVCAGR